MFACRANRKDEERVWLKKGALSFEVIICFQCVISLFRSLYFSAVVGRRITRQTTRLPLCCCVFWMAVQWVVMVLRDHSWERETAVHLCGLNEEREPTLSGLFKILWETRNVLFPDRQRESDDAAWMRGGDKWNLLHNLTSFARFQFKFELWMSHTFSLLDQSKFLSLRFVRM